jgi:hypothetical protein
MKVFDVVGVTSGSVPDLKIVSKTGRKEERVVDPFVNNGFVLPEEVLLNPNYDFIRSYIIDTYVGKSISLDTNCLMYQGSVYLPAKGQIQLL